jgi:hypothetical protein
MGLPILVYAIQSTPTYSASAGLCIGPQLGVRNKCEFKCDLSQRKHTASLHSCIPDL